MNARDLAALDQAIADKDVTIPTGVSVGELTNERGVFEALAVVLRRLRARLDDRSSAGGHRDIGFARVLDDWAEAWRTEAGGGEAADGSDNYPQALLQSESSDEARAIGTAPESDPADPSVDWISPDDQWAMWRRGEESGDARVTIYANYKPQLRTLVAAVRDLFSSGNEERTMMYLPLPEATLPAPFQGVLTSAQYPRAKVWLRPNAGAIEEEGDNTYRLDVLFSWSAVKLVARRRLPDLDPSTSVAFE